jgi:putative SOS response-associated peptidase YedK
MCGRYSFILEDELIKERFGVTVRSAIYKARYNCAPTQDLAVISDEEPGTLSLYRWGLIPFWAKDSSIGNKLINAKSETILEKPSFKSSFRNKRCLVLTDGYYEWKKENNEKIPYRITMKDGSAFSMAGIWDRWTSADGEIIHSFSILTTDASKGMQEIHDRMPVILDRAQEKKWLERTSESELLRLLNSFPVEKLSAYPVSKSVNSPRNDTADILVPLGDPLF